MNSGNFLLVEKIFFVLLMSFMSGSLFPFNMAGYTQGGHESVGVASNHYLWVVFGVSYAITSLLLVYRRAQALDVVRHCPWIMLLLLFACTSVFWSTMPDLTVRRCVAFLGTNLIGLYLATRFSLREILNLLIGSFCTVMACSLILIAFWPEYGINPEPHAGAWRGVFAQKNGFGIYCSFFYIVFLISAVTSKNKVAFLLFLLGLASSSIFVYASDSRTALVIQLFLLISYISIFLIGSRKRGSSRQYLAIACLAIATLAPLAISTIYSRPASSEASYVDDSNKSDASSQPVFKTSDINTLNGRTIIWSEVIKQAKKRPVAGFGYIGRNWPPPPHSGSPYKQITSGIKDRMNFYAPHPHNGYLRLFLALGSVGILIFFVAIIDIAKNVVLSTRRRGIREENLFGFLFVIWLLGVNILETYMASQNLIYWPMLVVAAATLSRSEKKASKYRKSNDYAKGSADAF